MMLCPIVEALTTNNWIGIVHNGAVHATRHQDPWKTDHTSFDFPVSAISSGDRFRIIDDVVYWTSDLEPDSKVVIETWGDRRGLNIIRHKGDDGLGWTREKV